jgi:4-cresol dehydrogenase (hydroxylating)
VIWLCPALPLDGNPVANLLARFEKMVREHGFEPSIGFNVVSPRCLHAFVMLAYDRDVPSEDERAMECHDRLFASMIEEGYYPYRLGIHSMALYRRLAGAGNPLIEAFKRQLDPNQILAPGRYE